MSSIPAVLDKMAEELKDPKYEGLSDEAIVASWNKKEDEVWWKLRRFCVEDLQRLRKYLR